MSPRRRSPARAVRTSWSRCPASPARPPWSWCGPPPSCTSARSCASCRAAPSRPPRTSPARTPPVRPTPAPRRLSPARAPAARRLSRRRTPRAPRRSSGEGEQPAATPAPTAQPTAQSTAQPRTPEEIAKQLADVNQDGVISSDPLPAQDKTNSSDSWITEKLLYDGYMTDCSDPKNLTGADAGPQGRRHLLLQGGRLPATRRLHPRPGRDHRHRAQERQLGPGDRLPRTGHQPVGRLAGLQRRRHQEVRRDVQAAAGLPRPGQRRRRAGGSRRSEPGQRRTRPSSPSSWTA